MLKGKAMGQEFISSRHPESEVLSELVLITLIQAANPGDDVSILYHTVQTDCTVQMESVGGCSSRPARPALLGTGSPGTMTSSQLIWALSWKDGTRQCLSAGLSLIGLGKERWTH